MNSEKLHTVIQCNPKQSAAIPMYFDCTFIATICSVSLLIWFTSKFCTWLLYTAAITKVSIFLEATRPNLKFGTVLIN